MGRQFLVHDHSGNAELGICRPTLTIRTDASREYKQALNVLYASVNFHPADIKVDSHLYDEKERIIYIYSRTWDDNGTSRPWTDLYTLEELARFEAALS